MGSLVKLTPSSLPDSIVYHITNIERRSGQVVLHFDNGYGASILGGTPYSYGDGVNTFELAILRGDNLCYTTGLLEDVLPYATREGIIAMLMDIVDLPDAIHEYDDQDDEY